MPVRIVSLVIGIWMLVVCGQVLGNTQARGELRAIGHWRRKPILHTG